jgi:Ig-like domain from next to BRCA1 gene
MKRKSLLPITLIVFSAMLLAACNLPMTSVSTPDPGLVFTQAAQTQTAQPTMIPTTIPPTGMITLEPPTPAIVLPPTSTSTSVPTATPTVAASPTTTTTPNEGSCTNQIEFVSDVTIPDDTELLPAKDFIKTWRLKNIGTCTWTNQYALVFISGDQMNGISPLPLANPVAPNSTVDLSVNLKAPGSTGSYKGNWELQNASGVIFGTGKNADQPFYVQIKVVEGLSDLNLGTPTWRDNMDNANNWYLLDTPNTKYSEGDGVLEMKALHPGGDEWDVSTQPAMKDYYLQATFITGAACSGLDRYGLLGRSPDPNKGYVLEFSCDGHYRLYTWDGQTYTALQEWTAASSIQLGPNQTNVMGLWMQGETLIIYANDYKVAEFTDSTYDEGKFGLAIASASTENFTVDVDIVEYWKFDQ